MRGIPVPVYDLAAELIDSAIGRMAVFAEQQFRSADPLPAAKRARPVKTGHLITILFLRIRTRHKRLPCQPVGVQYLVCIR